MNAATVSLPADLAPTLRERALELLDQVSLAPAHPDPREGGGTGHRCYACQQRGGKMTGHHVTATRIAWIHRKCHRRLHRAGRR